MHVLKIYKSTVTLSSFNDKVTLSTAVTRDLSTEEKQHISHTSARHCTHRPVPALVTGELPWQRH